jgi:hypothetical protein
LARSNCPRPVANRRSTLWRLPAGFEISEFAGSGRLKAGLQTFCLLAISLGATAAPAKAPELVDVQIYPPNVNLTTQRDRQSLVVQASFSDGTTRDVTTEATYQFTGEKPVARMENFTLHPIVDGQAELKAQFAGRTLTVPVKVEQAKAERPISFTLDVMPVFMKGGCNAGACHGASRGKDGFMLSLFGYDPDGDYFRITRENIGRRINLALPEDSLLLTKGAGQVQHTGGQLFTPDSELYQTVLRWVQAGAPKDKPDVAKPTGIEIYPKQAVLHGSGATQRLTVRATYSDGTDRDVTSLAAFMSNNDVSVEVSDDGRLTAHNRGEAFVLARFETFAVGAQVLVVPKDQEFVFPEVAANNYVDELVHTKLKKLRIAPSELADDATFLRRVYLDIIGLLPSPEEVGAFTADLSSGKRERVVDELLDRPEFADMWVMKWGELLRVRSVPQNAGYFSYKNAFSYYTWLRERIVKNEPIDRMVKDLLTASGGSFENPAANFYKIETATLQLSEDVAQVFMGIRTQCAQCHNHPFDRWTMDDYYSFAAFFAQVGRKTGEDPRETIVFNRNSGEVRHPVGGRNMKPKFLGGEEPELKPGQDRRAVLAEWLASSDNPYFSRNLVNMVWSHFLGRGIIEPVDDVRISNPPSNPELLDALAAQFTASNYDFKKLARDITTSRTYQLSTRANETNLADESNFSKAGIRRVRAEVLLDAINQVTENQEKFQGLPRGARAVQIVDGNETTYFLTTFGRAKRETVCSCEVVMDPSLSQALHLLNGNTVNDKIQSGGVVKRLLQDGKTVPQIIEELYLRCLARVPTEKETAQLQAFFAEGKNHEEVLNDLLWSLLNAKEFIFNH